MARLSAPLLRRREQVKHQEAQVNARRGCSWQCCRPGKYMTPPACMPTSRPPLLACKNLENTTNHPLLFVTPPSSSSLLFLGGHHWDISDLTSIWHFKKRKKIIRKCPLCRDSALWSCKTFNLTLWFADLFLGGGGGVGLFLLLFFFILFLVRGSDSDGKWETPPNWPSPFSSSPALQVGVEGRGVMHRLYLLSAVQMLIVTSAECC